ncbi:MAG: signal peptidase I [Acidimicrobiales bacterium]
MTDAPRPDGDTGPARPEESDIAAERPHAATQRTRTTKFGRSVIEWVVVIGGALILVVVVRAFFFQAFFIPSASMESTLKVHDRVLVNKLSYKFHSVHRGDIVVFTRPTCDHKEHPQLPTWALCTSEDKNLIKRVIALPGETIELRDGAVYIDGRKLKEPYVHGEPSNTANCLAFPGTYRIPKGFVFVMGDNRTDSADSRCFGPIPKGTIEGRAFVLIWPLNRLALL